ncbi:MAG TPA: hypothetical protein VHS09_12970 [Polyangiaceae bacterium]|nr:hypothetical protein [Polyangiaceae bacterium]
MQAAPPPPIPPKKKRSGCLLALAIVGGVALVLVAVVGFAVYRFASSKEGKMVFGTIGDMAELAAEAQRAPGTKQVAALGCDTAMAMDMDKMQRIMHDRLDAASAKPLPFSRMVVCQVGVFAKSPPSCGDVARTYVAAAGPPDRGFAVNVQRNGGGSSPLCSVLYDPAGVKVKDLAPGSTPAVPGAK